MKKGEVTAFLSLIFILILSLIGAVTESASIQAAKNKRRGDVDRAVESVFAEYQRELLESYDVFALEGTYETGEFSEENIIDRLQIYDVGNGEHQVQKMQFLTDDSGRAFREQVIAYMKHKMGITQLESLTNVSAKWKEQETKGKEYEEENINITEELETSLAGEGKELPDEKNPIKIISDIKNAGLLHVVIKNQENISNKSISIETMPSHRSLQKGRGTFKRKEDTENPTSSVYFSAYQLEKFAAADQPEEEGKLSYELEYILGGKETDQKNLEETVGKLTALRFAPNYGYLLTDEVKKQEAEAMALTLAGILSLPALTEVIRHAILLAWAFGESIMDVRTLLDGGKVELVKTNENWQLKLSSLFTLGTGEDKMEVNHSEKGLSYKEYLRILLFMSPKEESTMRSLDVLEMKMQMKKGTFFQVDHCVSKMEIRSRCHMRRGITYEFSTEYGYQ